MKHAAALLGVVTRAANACPMIVKDEDGSERTVLKRDACRVGVPGGGKKRCTSAPLPEPPQPAEAAVEEAAPADEGCEDEEGRREEKRRRTHVADLSTLTPCLAPLRRAALRAGLAKEKQEQETALELLVRRRAESAARPPLVSAAERRAALHARVLARLNDAAPGNPN